MMLYLNVRIRHQAVQEWIGAVGAKTVYIAPGSSMGERVHREF